MQARRKAHTLERLLLVEPFADLTQYRHLPLCPIDPPATTFGLIGDLDELERVIRLSREWPGIIRFAGNAAAKIRHNRELGWLQQDVALDFPDFFRELMQRARERGELDARVSVDEAAELLLVLISGLSTSPGTDEHEQQFVARVRTFERLLRGQLLRAPDEPAIHRPADARK